jgi:hypothetical protein
MNDTTPDRSPDPKQGQVACRRTGQLYDTTECERCPYCFGEDADLAGGDRETFCDFHPGKDPVHFGFPGDDARTLHG